MTRASDRTGPTRRTRRAGRLALALVTGLTTAGLTLAGCGSAVSVSVPPLAGREPCATIAWPASVGGVESVPTEPADPATHAWGDPAIIGRCGVPVVPPTTLECLGVDDVDWVLEPLSDGIRFTTYGRDPAMQVLVPDAYAPEPLVLGSLTETARTLPATGRHCR